LHDPHLTQRLNVRHLPTIPLPKIGATNGPTAANRFQSNNLFFQSITSTATNSVPQYKKTNLKHNKYGVEPLHNKPRTITIVKQGTEKPHKTITILLNRRTAQTFDQLLSDISEAFGYQKYRTDKVRSNLNCLFFFFLFDKNIDSIDQTFIYVKRTAS
jgi:hypothetical protein